MTNKRRWQESVKELSRHFPPSGAQLQAFVTAFGSNRQANDLAATLRTLRPDLEIRVSENAAGISCSPPVDPLDAVVACGVWQMPLADRKAFLADALGALRPGGRLLLLDSTSPGGVMKRIKHPAKIMTLEDTAFALAEAGFARVLAERVAVDSTILSRGEKPYSASSTVERLAQSAAREGSAGEVKIVDSANLEALGRGRFIFVLVRQSPDKPAWAILPGEKITWQAQMVSHSGEGGRPYLLVFSSLPKAVEFMQAAVLAGLLLGVNKVAKFDKAVAGGWHVDILFDPALQALRATQIYSFEGVQLTVDPETSITGQE